MGIPEFLKFAARAPSGLSVAGQTSGLSFDFVLIDGTNILQTMGIESAAAILSHRTLAGCKAIVVAFDSVRDRAASSREQRALVHTHAFNVEAQQLCTRIVAAAGSVPVFISGRDVDGEADFKILHLVRVLSREHSGSRFLVISEDSDILAGGLCGPCARTTYMAARFVEGSSDVSFMNFATTQDWLCGGSPTLGGSGGPPEDTKSWLAAARKHFVTSVDVTLLFTLLKGSGNLSGLVKGATKVDLNAAWSTYTANARQIVSFRGNSIHVDPAALLAVVESIQFADTGAHASGGEQHAACREYLRHALKALVRYVLGERHTDQPPALLDSRRDTAVAPPPFAAFCTFLAHSPSITLGSDEAFPLLRADESALAATVEAALQHLASAAPLRLVHKALVPAPAAPRQSAPLEKVSDRWTSAIAFQLAAQHRAGPAEARGGAFSFSLRRMVERSNTKSTASTNAILAAAGLSLGYTSAAPSAAPPSAAPPASAAAVPPPAPRDPKPKLNQKQLHKQKQQQKLQQQQRQERQEKQEGGGTRGTQAPAEKKRRVDAGAAPKSE